MADFGTHRTNPFAIVPADVETTLLVDNSTYTAPRNTINWDTYHGKGKFQTAAMVDWGNYRGTSGGGPVGVPTVGQLWPRGDHITEPVVP